MLPRVVPLLFLAITCAPTQAEIFTGVDDKPAPVPTPPPKSQPGPSPQEQAQEVKDEADYAKQLASMAQAGGLLEKVRIWQNTAEANPQAIVTLPLDNPKSVFKNSHFG